jgi:molecular chaperone DnaK (HSP70)
VPQHVELELHREEPEETILPLLKQTLESVHRALTDAGKRAADLDGILLVGGATRTPLVSELLEQATGLTPRQGLHPDLCVALRAGVQAARLEGDDIERVLVDVSPWSFGISYLGYLGDMPSDHCFKAVITRNPPLPASRIESFATVRDDQDVVQISVFQGEDPDALRNVFIGDFLIEGLSAVPAPNEILCRMDLDLDGILRVTATEKQTGLSKQITPSRRPRLLASRAWPTRAHACASSSARTPKTTSRATTRGLRAMPGPSAETLLARSQALLDKIPVADREEAIALNEQLHLALTNGRIEDVARLAKELEDFPCFVEERRDAPAAARRGANSARARATAPTSR